MDASDDQGGIAMNTVETEPSSAETTLSWANAVRVEMGKERLAELPQGDQGTGTNSLALALGDCKIYGRYLVTESPELVAAIRAVNMGQAVVPFKPEQWSKPERRAWEVGLPHETFAYVQTLFADESGRSWYDR
jgi:hypothetical protein